MITARLFYLENFPIYGIAHLNVQNYITLNIAQIPLIALYTYTCVYWCICVYLCIMVYTGVY